MARIHRYTDAASINGEEYFILAKLSATVKITATTIRASSADNSYKDTGDGFIAAGFVVNMAVNVSGFPTNPANNIVSGIIQTLTAGIMVIASPDGDVIVSEVAGSSITITAWETVKAKTLVTGKVVPESLVIAASDETTALTTGTAKTTFRMPYGFTLTGVRASLSTAQASGTIFTVDVNESGTSILSTKLTIDNTEKTSTTAAAAAVISDTALANDAEITIDIDQVGDGTAKGLKVYLIGTQT